jgi:beta-glucosidase
MMRPELLALFPPMPDGFDLFSGRGDDPGDDSDEGGDQAGPIMTGGMGGDRTSLRLRAVDELIIEAVAVANPRTVVAIVAAGAVLTEGWRDLVPATLIMWYAGMEGGNALADVLLGHHNPSGRLPFSIPSSDEHLPSFDRDATKITYGRLHGQRLLDRLGVVAAVPHGFGLSYTTFAIDEADVVGSAAHGPRLRVTVRNTGGRDGRHVVQVYGSRRSGSYAGELLLAGFSVADVPAGERVQVTVDVSLVALAEWDPATRQRVVPPPADVTLEVGAHAHDPSAVAVDLAAP